MRNSHKPFLNPFTTIFFILILCSGSCAQDDEDSNLLDPEIPLFGVWKSDSSEEKITISVFDAQNLINWESTLSYMTLFGF